MMPQKWNRPRTNVIKVAVTFLGFLEMGLNDASTGAVLPFVERYYSLNDIQVSSMFLVGILGSFTAALSSVFVHKVGGRRGASWMGLLSHLFGFLCIGYIHQRFEFVLLGEIAIGFGGGFLNGTWNAWVGAFENAHGVLGILHGCYAIGGMISPALVSIMAQHGKPWFAFYQMLLFYCCFVLFCAFIAFQPDTANEYRKETGAVDFIDNETRRASQVEDACVTTPLLNTDSTEPQQRLAHLEVSPFSFLSVWILALFLCTYNGIEIGYSGWIVTYMIRERHGDPNFMGFVSTAFWTGLTLGRIALGFVTGRFSSLKNVILFYFAGATFFHLLFWLGGAILPTTIITDSICIFFAGLFIGPIFPSAMVMATSVLPSELHVSGISTAAAISGCGAALLPLTIGALIQSMGMKILPLIILISLIFNVLLWTIFCGQRKHMSPKAHSQRSPTVDHYP